MRVEIRLGETGPFGGVKLTELRAIPFASQEGRLGTRRRAVVEVDGQSIELDEGSLIELEGTKYRVIRISKAKNLLRLRPADADRGRFEPLIREHADSTGAFDGILGVMVLGVEIVNDVLVRIDDHPDTVMQFAAPLARAKDLLGLARIQLERSGEKAPGLKRFIARNIRVCSQLHEMVMSSTHEQEVAD